MSAPATTASPAPEAVGRYLLVLALLGLVTAVLFVASLFTGRSPATLMDLFLGGAVDDRQILWLIFNEIRVPRALLATLVGATLGLAGAVLQGYLRNPLAEPGLVGASSTAALGAVLMLYTGASTWSPMALPLGGIAGAIIGLALVTLLAGGRSGALTLILAGVAVNTLAAALTSLALNLAPSPYAALEIIFWLMGSLADRSFEHVRVALPFMRRTTRHTRAVPPDRSHGQVQPWPRSLSSIFRFSPYPITPRLTATCNALKTGHLTNARRE